MEQKQRVHARYDVRLPIRFQFEGVDHQGQSRNLSIGGLFLETEVAVPYGATLKITFKIPNYKEDITVVSTVCWVERSGNKTVGLGLKFAALRAIEVWSLNQLFAQSNPV